MTQLVRDRNGNLIAVYAPSKPQWWITSFNPKYKDMKANDLTTLYTVNMKDNQDMYEALKDAYSKKRFDPNNPSYWFFDNKNNIAIHIFPMKVCAG